MGQVCKTCKLPPGLLDKVNRQLVEGRVPQTVISREVGISTDSLRHHKRRCVHTNLVRATAAREADYAQELLGLWVRALEQIEPNIEALRDVIKHAKKKKHSNTTIKGTEALLKHLETLYKMLAHHAEIQQDADIAIQVRQVFNDPHFGQRVQQLTTEELRWFHRVVGKLAGEPLLIEQKAPVIGVEPVGACATCEQCDAAEKSYRVRMVRTKAPVNACEEIDHDSPPAAAPSAPIEPETQGPDDDEPVPPRHWRPPLGQIHFTSAQAFVGHLYRGRRK